MGKATGAYSRDASLQDTTLGWRFVNPAYEELYGIDSMAETAEHVARENSISREDQDSYALRSQQRAEQARVALYLAEEITPVKISRHKSTDLVVDTDEHPRPDTGSEQLARLRPIVSPGGSVTAGNASGINDGAAALLLASGEAVTRFGFSPRARVIGTAVAGVEPRIMGLGPVPATRKLLARAGLTLDEIDVIEINEAFAAQVLGVTRQLGLADNDSRVNPNGGAIALGHPLGASGSRILLSAVNELHRRQGRYALCAMCIGVGQGIAMLLERV
jgi:acetyl-CoA acetyltransferase family protein